MLFVFPRSLRPQFAMKTVSFPLSLGFIRTDGTLACIRRMEPGGRVRARAPMPVRYVLEVNQGWFRSRGVTTGESVEFSSGE
jgi:hypothetical protein